jgi:hypothetical protein
MRIWEILYESAKYPFYGVKQFILLGFIILITVSVFGYYGLFGNYLHHFLGVDYWVLLLLLISLASILLLFEAGYAFRMVQKSIEGINVPPKFNKFDIMFKHGINETVLISIYFSIPLIILYYILNYTLTPMPIIILFRLVDYLTSGWNILISPIPDQMLFILVIFVVILGFILDMIFTVAIPYMASKGGSFREAFNFKEIFKKIKKIGLRRMLIAYFLVLLTIVVMGGPLLIKEISQLNIIGFIIAEGLIAPYIVMLDSRFIALLYMNPE